MIANYSQRENANIVLITYSGYPETNSTWLHLDNGVALLAGALMTQGHNVRIHDLQRLEVWEDLFPHDYRGEYFTLKSEFDKFLFNHNKDKKTEGNLVDRIIKLEDKIDSHNKRILIKYTEEIIEKSQDFNPDIFGFKLWAQNSLMDQFLIAQELKKAFPSSLLVGGGPAVEFYHEYIMKKHDVFDILVYGPGEKTIQEIAAYSLGKKELHTIGGIIYKSNGVIEKTRKEYPEIKEKFSYIYDRSVYLDYDKKLHNVHVESTRGCSSRCNFCFHPSKSGSLQLKPPEIFVDEIEELNKTYGFSYFHLAGSNPPFGHLVNIAGELDQRQCNFGFMGFQSLRSINNKEMDLMKKGNFDWFWIGIESGSNSLLKEMNKKRTAEEVVERFKMLTNNGISTTASIIIPSVGESDETVMATIDVLKQINPDVLIIYPPIVQPQSQWFDSKEGSVIVEESEQVMYDFIEYGMEWHPGNKILPMVFRSPILAGKILFDGKSYKDTFYIHKHHERMIKNSVYGNNLVAKYKKKQDSSYKLKRIYFKSQVVIANAIHNGNFTRAKKVLNEYNDIVACGELC